MVDLYDTALTKAHLYATTTKTEDLHPWVRVDQAKGLSHRKHLAFW